MADPRKGLQRRYDLEQILELHKGKPKIQGLNYDALAMLRSPLYIKMGQELKTESQDQTNRILTVTEELNNIRRLSSQRDLPHDLLNGFNGFDDDMGGPGGGATQEGGTELGSESGSDRKSVV